VDSVGSAAGGQQAQPPDVKLELEPLVEVLERRAILDQQPKFVEEGVTALDTVVYRLRRR